jgi:putative transposon-encoded protein
MTEEMRIEVSGYEVIEKKVEDAKTSGRVYLPKRWVGRHVKVVLLEQIIAEKGE